MQGTPLLYGATGEIITEKSGNLNLGIPGIMYVGAISGVIGAFFYQTNTAVVNPFLAVLIPLLSSILGSLLVTLIYCFLTITLRANQNVTGLAITTFGVGVGNFFGGSLIKVLKSDVPYLALTDVAKAFKRTLPFAENMQAFGKMIFSYGFMVYLAIIIAVITSIILKRTKLGLNLRAVGENPATADAAGINVNAYKYFATAIGGVIAGLGGLYYVMDYSNGIWSNNGFGDSYLCNLETRFRYFRLIRFRRAVHSFQLSQRSYDIYSDYSDAALCSNNHCSCCSIGKKEEGTPSSRFSRTFIFQRGQIIKKLYSRGHGNGFT